MGIVKSFFIKDVGFDIGSDMHCDFKEPKATVKLADCIIKDKVHDTLVLAGDIFNTPNGENSSPIIQDLLNRLSLKYKQIIFCPGNHDLRGRNCPWDDFQDLPTNIITPYEDKPIIQTIHGVQFLIANIFFDMDFIDPWVIWLTLWEITKYYALSGDRFFLSWDVSKFGKFTTSVARKLTPEIDVLVTHALPHPSLATIRVESITSEIEKMQNTTGLKFICREEFDREEAKKLGINPELYRQQRNIKSCLMGSNVLGHTSAHPREWLSIIYGHHHKNDSGIKLINWISINCITFQNRKFRLA